MLLYLKYFFLVLPSTFIGALTGLGGGVIMKPFMDLFGDFSAPSISIMTSFTVMIMAAAAIIKQTVRKSTVTFSFKNCMLLALGSVAGGLSGQLLIGFLTKDYPDYKTKTLQNIMLAVLIVFVFIYMLIKHKIKSPSLSSPIAFLVTGLILGTSASLLGIGGGPLNIALCIFVFGIEMKQAVFYSMVAIFFGQSAKLLLLIASGSFVGIDFAFLTVMIITGTIGAFIGTYFGKRMPARAVERSFNIAQSFIFGLCILNVVMLNM